MKRCNVYKMKPEAKKRLNAIHDYYYAENFLQDVHDRDFLYISMVGINTDTLEFSQMLDMFCIKHTEFEDVFEEEPFMTTEQLNNKLWEIQKMEGE